MIPDNFKDVILKQKNHPRDGINIQIYMSKGKALVRV